MNRKRVLSLGSLVVILGTFAYLLFGGLGENIVFFLTPQELLAKEDKGYDVPVRLGGQVLPGSVQWNADSLSLRFRLTDGGKDVLVHSKGAPPQMFRDGMGVVVEGRFHRDGVFQATNLMVKHSNEYRAPHPGEKPSEMYRTLIKGGQT